MKKLKNIMLGILTIACFQLKSQIALTYIPFQSLLGISTNTEKLFWLDYKLETNTFASNLNMEVSPKINFRRTEFVNYYLGPGISFNPVYTFADLSVTNGYFLDFGGRIKPFEKNRNVQLVFELSPYVNGIISSGNIRTRLGIAYNFGKRNKSENKQQ